MNICDLIEELENIKTKYGEDIEVAVQDRINENMIDPYLKLTYSKREFLSRTSGDYFVNKVVLL